MTHTSSTNLQLAMLLPLGVIASQLKRVEADLRFLTMKAASISRQEGAAIGQVAPRLEEINEALDSIRALTADLQADLQSPVRKVALPPRQPDNRAADRDD